jgi:hypothetical protein
VAVPASTVALFLFPDHFHMLGPIGAHYGHLLYGSVPLTDRLAALVFAMIPTAIATWGLLALARLFQQFAAGEVFSNDSLKALGTIAAALFWNVIASLATEPPITYFLTHARHFYTQITLGPDDAELLFLAGIAFVIARVMAEARNVAEENSKFV